MVETRWILTGHLSHAEHRINYNKGSHGYPKSIVFFERARSIDPRNCLTEWSLSNLCRLDPVSGLMSPKLRRFQSNWSDSHGGMAPGWDGCYPRVSENDEDLTLQSCPSHLRGGGWLNMVEGSHSRVIWARMGREWLGMGRIFRAKCLRWSPIDFPVVALRAPSKYIFFTSNDWKEAWQERLLVNPWFPVHH